MFHVSRNAFGTESWEQDLAIARVLYFFEKHWEELLKFSRRTPRQLGRWAAPDGYKERVVLVGKETPKDKDVPAPPKKGAPQSGKDDKRTMIPGMGDHFSAGKAVDFTIVGDRAAEGRLPTGKVLAKPRKSCLARNDNASSESKKGTPL